MCDDGFTQATSGAVGAVVGALRSVGVAALAMGVTVVVPACSSSRSDRAGRTPDLVCEVLRPRGLLPSEWFDGSGALALTEEEAGALAVSLGARAGFTDDDDLRTVVDLLGARLDDDVEVLSTEDQRTLDRLDDDVEADCPK